MDHRDPTTVPAPPEACLLTLQNILPARTEDGGERGRHPHRNGTDFEADCVSVKEEPSEEPDGNLRRVSPWRYSSDEDEDAQSDEEEAAQLLKLNQEFSSRIKSEQEQDDDSSVLLKAPLIPIGERPRGSKPVQPRVAED
jgi:hypothetical protein